jgi:hypothetical protein
MHSARRTGRESASRAAHDRIAAVPMAHLTPLLPFGGTCAGAMTFYKSCLGGELAITRIS